jgi:DNA-binding GntR family transcriptional regulator
MREAMRILLIEGLLRHSLYKGVSVSELSLRDVKDIYQLRRMLQISGVRAASKSRHPILGELQSTLGEHEAIVRLRHWMKAVSFDLEFHILLIRFHQNRRLESFYRNMIGELRVGTVLVDRSRGDPGILIPVHRKICDLLRGGKLKQ